MNESISRPVRVRIAPSPTGYVHIGNLRTMLYNWFFARHHQGTFIMRIEDTDRSRLVEDATIKMCRTLQDVGLTPDEGVMLDEAGAITERGAFGPYTQSLCKDRHIAYAHQLMDMGKAYYCFCTKERLEQLSEEQRLMKVAPMYDRKCRSISRADAEARVAAGEEHVIRLAVPLEGAISMDDLIRGSIEIPWAQVDDQVLIKSDGFPTYHIANTCDDHDMQITHVIRGEEWISSFPKHLFLYDAFGWEPPKFAHVPLLLNPDRSKLSKRQGDVAAEDYLAKGYLPEALINFLALLGWNPTSDREIFTKEELAEMFEITKVNKAGAVFNLEKLNWLNAHYLKEISEEVYLALCRTYLNDVERNEWTDDALIDRACLIARERLEVPTQLPTLVDFIFKQTLDTDPAMLVWKKSTKEEAVERLNGVRAFLDGRMDPWFLDREMIERDLREMIVDKGWGNGDTLWPLRVALSGLEKSPSPFELLFAYGKKRSMMRIDEAIARLA